MSELKVVILAPWRAGSKERERLWAFARKRWEADFPDAVIVEGAGPVEGPFNRSAAINEAARTAGDGWDVAVIIDTDIITNAAAVRSGIETAHATNAMVVTHDERVMLSRSGTNKVLGGYLGSWRTRDMHERVYADSVSCSVVVSRKLWDAIGGFDEMYVGWGREDSAFQIACEAVSGKPIVKLVSECFHLWHTVTPEAKQGSPIRQKNEARHQRYVAARWNREAVLALLAESRQVVNGVPLPATPIPRILHRTLPAEIDPVVEGYWTEFRRLHPGWVLESWREPLDPKNWPLTGHLFSKCKTGAQRGGLVRLEIVWHRGGFYVDSDVRPFRSLEPLLHGSMYAAWEDEKVVPDAVFGATPQHPAIGEMIEKATSAVKAGKGAWDSGPGVFTSTLPGRPDVLLLPPGSFYEIHYEDKARLGEPPKPHEFVRHLWAHSWGTPAEKARIERRQR